MSRITLVAPEGYYYTDGVNYAKISYLAEGVSKDKYYLITEEEYDAIISSDEQLLNENTVVYN